MTKERNLPDDAADHYAEYDNSIDSFISNPAGPSTLRRVAELEAEYAAQSAELKLLRDRYDLHGDEDSREGLFQSELENEVARMQEWAGTSEEAENIYRKNILQDWQSSRAKPDDSVDAFIKPQRDRLRQEHERFYPKSEEDE